MRSVSFFSKCNLHLFSLTFDKIANHFKVLNNNFAL